MATNAQYQNKGMTGNKREAGGGKPTENGDTNGSRISAALKGRIGLKNDSRGGKGANIGLLGQQETGGAAGGGGRGGDGPRGRGRGGGRGQHEEGGRGRGGRGGRGGGMGEKDRIMDKLRQLGGPLIDLPPREEKEKKFSNHCRLWIGNLPLDIGEDDVKKLFKPYGDFDEVYFDKNKGFAFVRMDYKVNAEKARSELNMKEYHGRQLKIRFSSPGTALKIRNLSSLCSNELLEISFGVFGEIEKAMVLTDERGRSTGEGIVEFCRKPHAMLALRKCQEGCFILNSSPRPVIVEPMAAVDENEGLSEINIYKRNPEYVKERQDGPHFANAGSFEFEYGQKWKQLYEMFDKKKEALVKELQDEKNKLEEQMEFAKYEHETEMLRDQLRQREVYNERNKPDYEARQREWDEHRRMENEQARRQEEELTLKYRQQEEELRRRQEENRLFMQERAEAMKETYNDNYMSSYQQTQRRGDGYSQGGRNWASGGGGDSWARGVSAAQAHSPGQYDNEWDDRSYHLQVPAGERMGFSRGASTATTGTNNSGSGVANDNDLQSTDLRKLLERRGKKLEQETGGAAGESDLRKLLDRAGRGKKPEQESNDFSDYGKGNTKRPRY